MTSLKKLAVVSNPACNALSKSNQYDVLSLNGHVTGIFFLDFWGLVELLFSERRVSRPNVRCSLYLRF